MPMTTEALRSLLNQQPDVSAQLNQLAGSRPVATNQGAPLASAPQATPQFAAKPQRTPDLASAASRMTQGVTNARNAPMNLGNVPTPQTGTPAARGSTGGNGELLRYLTPRRMAAGAQGQSLTALKMPAAPGLSTSNAAPAAPQKTGLLNRNMRGM